MGYRVFQVDAFASQPFEGNPAAVCLLEADRQASGSNTGDEQWMQSLAAEMNLSETAFVSKRVDGSYDLRWFTPTTEVNLCGHATLATAHVLWTQTDLGKNEKASFHTRSGELEVTNQNGLMTMNFPLDSLDAIDDQIQLEKLNKILGVKIANLYQANEDWLVELDSEQQLIDLKPDLTALVTISIRCLIVTAKSANYDFVSRVFGPAVGIDEDPVTGSAHCSLTPFWAKKLNKTELSARQVSARGGDLFLQLQQERVFISGRAITVFKGELL